ncbi:MAG TPA: response regulator, partial [Pyrinomonadaceae bacterium]|jgi:DNA-binding response OmpR family regulator
MCLVCADKSEGGVKRVLVIDDEPSVADALRVILEDEGFAVEVARSGREGMEQARRAGFRVTITDLRLPDMNGLEVICAFREGGVGGSLILITSHGTPEIFSLALDLGAVNVIAKPFRPSEILQLVTAALTGRESCAP